MTGTVLLTGATGFVGRQVLRALCEAGRRVRIVARPGRAGMAKGLCGTGRCEIVETRDLFAEDPARLGEFCRGVDTLVHLAWIAEPGRYLTAPENMDCLTGTLNLARAAAGAGVRRFVGTGTCLEYDTDSCVLSTDTPLRPRSPYAAAKAGAYLALSGWLPSRGVEFAWCRLFHLYGEGEDPRRLVAYLHARLAAGRTAELSSGRQIRDYLDVAEAGRKIAEVALGDRQGAVNICSGVPVTVRQLAEDIADRYGRRDLLVFGARPDDPADPPCILGKDDDRD